MILDDQTKISELDTENMFQMVYDWPELIEEILQHSFTLPVKTKVGRYTISYDGPISQILICGMGGSAISGEYLSVYLKEHLKVPVIVNRNYEIPAFTSENTLIILISYSGNTEETISCLITAVKRSAKIIGIGSGGTLEDFCKKHNLPFFPIPSGYQPRASFPLLFFPLLKILHSFELLPLNESTIDETLSLFRQMRQEYDPKIPIVNNKAKQTALKLHNHIPVIWSPFGCVAHRMKCQLNENSKILALAEELPELNHNHIVGWESWEKENPFLLIIYRFQNEHLNVALRFKITKEILKDKVEIIEIIAQGTSFLSQLFSATYYGDYISMYLAILNNQNPNTVDSIVYLKNQLEIRKQTQTKLINTLHSVLEN